MRFIRACYYAAHGLFVLTLVFAVVCIVPMKVERLAVVCGIGGAALLVLGVITGLFVSVSIKLSGSPSRGSKP